MISGYPQLEPSSRRCYRRGHRAANAPPAVVAANAAGQQQFERPSRCCGRTARTVFASTSRPTSTIAPDEQAEKQARVEFLQQMVPLLEQVVPLAMGNPALASLCREVALFAARGFRVARPLEQSIEHAFEALAQMPPGASGEAGGAKSGELARCRARAHAIAAHAQIERDKNAIAAAKAAGDHQLEQVRLASHTAAERARLAMDAERLETEKASLHLRATALAAQQAKEMT